MSDSQPLVGLNLPANHCHCCCRQYNSNNHGQIRPSREPTERGGISGAIPRASRTEWPYYYDYHDVPDERDISKRESTEPLACFGLTNV